MAVFIVVHAGGSLRCAAKTVGFLSEMMGWKYGRPSQVTIRNWVLRCGLYQLDYAKAKAGRYVGIIDESIQIGREKMLLFLGVKLSDERSHAAPLTLEDVEVLGVEVQQSWLGHQVVAFIKKRLAHHSGIRLQYVISDQGTNLLAAVQKQRLHSAPSDLKITDVKCGYIRNGHSLFVKVYSNQDIVGHGEAVDATPGTYHLVKIMQASASRARTP